MLSTLRVTEPPVDTPVTIERVREHCRVTHPGDDGLLEMYLAAAVTMAEGYLSRALLTQTLLWTLRPSPRDHYDLARLRGELRIPRAPVQSIATVTFRDRQGNASSIPAATQPVPPNTSLTGYIADLSLEPATLRLGGSSILVNGDALAWSAVENVQVSIVAGYETPELVPPNIVQALLITVAFLYENRGDAGGDLPKAAEWLLDRDRLIFLGGP
jgi:uncharacterized phiE125 gp8 family phage protein